MFNPADDEPQTKLALTLAHDYFRVDLQGRLPLAEGQRRRLIQERIEAQYAKWLSEEQQSRRCESEYMT